MTQENKELLLKDLCARLPYKVKISIPELFTNKKQVETLNEIFKRKDSLYCVNDSGILIEYVKPYLFPLSSMTEEQCNKFYCGFVENETDYNDFKKYYFDGCLWNKVLTSINDCGDIIDWFNKNHFDYRGLIPMELAIDATGLNIY